MIRRGTAASARAGVAIAILVAAACGPLAPAPDRYPHEREAIGTVRESYDGTLSDSLAVQTFRNIHRLFPTRVIARPAQPRGLAPSAHLLAKLAIPFGDSTVDLNGYLAANRVSGLLILKDGRIVTERYRFGNGPRTRWMSMSIAKSVSSTLVGAAIRDGAIRSLDDSVTRYVPALAGSAYDGVTIRDVLMMSSGVRWSERYTDPASDRRRLLEAQISQVPGSALAVMGSLPRDAPPGTVNTYSTGETQVLAEVLRGALKRPLADYLSERIWRPMGAEADARWWLDSPDGVEIGGSGISATLRDYGRFGQFILDEGVIGADTVLPPGWVREATTPKVLRDGRPLDYGYMWWPGTSAAARRDRAFSAVGIHGQFLHVNPAAHVVIVVWSAQPQPTGGAVIDDGAFFDAVVASLRGTPRS